MIDTIHKLCHPTIGGMVWHTDAGDVEEVLLKIMSSPERIYRIAI